MERGKRGINETKADLNLLLECLKCQLDCPSALSQALTTISTVCIYQAGSKDHLRECGGLQFIFSLATSTGYVEVKETALFAVGCAVEGNVFSQKLMNTREMFMFLHGCLSNHYGRKKLLQTATYCIICLVANNGQGQMLMRKSGCLQILLDLFRNTLTTEEFIDGECNKGNLQLWLTIGSALCVGVNNPQNDDNQRFCASGFPFAMKCLEEATEVKILRSAASFIGVTVASNVHNQDRIAKCNGLTVLINVLFKILNRIKTSDEYLELSVHVTKALDACIADNVENAKTCGDAGAIPLLLKLLAVHSADDQLKLQIVLTIGHCTDICAANQRIVIDSGGINTLIQQLTESTDEELTKAIKYVLQICVNTEEAHPRFDSNMMSRRYKSPLTVSRPNHPVLQDVPYGMNMMSPGDESAGGDAIMKKLGDIARKLQGGPSSDTETEMEGISKATKASSAFAEKEKLQQQLEKERNLRMKYESEAYQLRQAQDDGQTPRTLKRLENILKRVEDTNLVNRTHIQPPETGGNTIYDKGYLPLPRPAGSNHMNISARCRHDELMSPIMSLKQLNKSNDPVLQTPATSTPDRRQNLEIESINKKLNNLQVTLENLVDKRTMTEGAGWTGQGDVRERGERVESVSEEQSQSHGLDGVCGQVSKDRGTQKYKDRISSQVSTTPATSTSGRLHPKRHLYGTDRSSDKRNNTPDEERKGDDWIDLPSTPHRRNSRTEVCDSSADLVLTKVTVTPSRKRILMNVPQNVFPRTPSGGLAGSDSQRNIGTPRSTLSRGQAGLDSRRNLLTPQSAKSSKSNISVRSARRGQKTLELVYTVDSNSDSEEYKDSSVKQTKTPKSLTPDEDGFLKPHTPVKRRRLSEHKPSSQCKPRTPQRQLFPLESHGTPKSKGKSPRGIGTFPITPLKKKRFDRSFDEDSEYDCTSTRKSEQRRQSNLSINLNSGDHNVRITPRKGVNQARDRSVSSVQNIQETHTRRHSSDRSRRLDIQDLPQGDHSWDSKTKSENTPRYRSRCLSVSENLPRHMPRSLSVSENTPRHMTRSLSMSENTPRSRSRNLSQSDNFSERDTRSSKLDRPRHPKCSPNVEKKCGREVQVCRKPVRTPNRQDRAIQNPSLTGVRSSWSYPEQKVTRSCQPKRNLLRTIQRAGMGAEEESFDSDSDLDTTLSSPSSTVQLPKNNQKCPGCQPAQKISIPTVNSRTYNIALETSHYTCSFHRRLRELERDYMGRTATPASRMLQTLQTNQNGMKKIKTPMSVYDFPSSSGSDSADPLLNSKRVTPPRKVSPIATSKFYSDRDTSKRRQRIPYSDEELRNLKDGVQKMGKFWNQILCTYKFHPSRRAIDLMEKHKRLVAKERSAEKSKESPRSTPCQPFSMCEERRLRRGVKLYGYNWKTILVHFKFNRDRTAEQLRQKWRNMNKHGKL